MASSQVEAPWYAAYPTARNSNPESITRHQLLQLINDGKEPGKDFALIDLRRNDFEVARKYIAALEEH